MNTHITDIRVLSLVKKFLTSNFVKYILIGFTGLSLDLLIYNFLINTFNMLPYYANIVSMFTSINNNFLLNTYFNFRKKDKLLLRWLSFVSIGIAGIFLSDFLLIIFYGMADLSPNLAKIITIPIIAILQFFLHKLITYK